MTENGQRRTVKKIEAVFLAQVNKAMRGDNKAAAQVLVLADKFEITKPEQQKIAAIEWTVIDAKGNIMPELSR